MKPREINGRIGCYGVLKQGVSAFSFTTGRGRFAFYQGRACKFLVPTSMRSRRSRLATGEHNANMAELGQPAICRREVVCQENSTK